MGMGRHMSTVSTMLSSEQPSSVSSPLFWNRTLCTFGGSQKRLTMLLFSTLFLRRSTESSVIRRHFQNRSDKSSSQCKINIVTANGKVVAYQSFLSR